MITTYAITRACIFLFQQTKPPARISPLLLLSLSGMMTTVQENHWSSSDALLQSSAAENREQLLPSSPDNTPLPPSSPTSATSGPPAEEYGDDDIDDVLFDDRRHTGNNSGRIRAVSDLLQGKEQKMGLERKKKRTFSLPIKISLYDGPSDSNYNHLDPSKYSCAHSYRMIETGRLSMRL